MNCNKQIISEQFKHGHLMYSTAEQALNNPLILHKICQALCNKDLLHCSLVNSTWNFIARSILRKNRICRAHIHGEVPCEELLNWCSTLSSANQLLPFNGLSFSFKYTFCLRCSHCTVSAEVLNILQSKIDFKHINVDYGNCHSSLCSSVGFIDGILNTNKNNLITLEIANSHRYSILTTNPSITFPNLNCLTVHRGCNEHVLSHVLRTSPNLKFVKGPISSYDIQIFVENQKTELVQEFELKYVSLYGQYANINACVAFALERPRLQCLIADVQDFHRNKRSKEYFCILEAILFSGQDSLQSLRIDEESLQWIANSDLPSSLRQSVIKLVNGTD